MPQVPVAKIPETENRDAVSVLQSSRGSEDPRAFGFGTGGEKLGQALQNVGGMAAAIAKDLKEQDDERAAKDADTEFSKAVRTSLYGDEQNPGYLRSQGRNAIDQVKSVDEALEKARREIGQKLSVDARKLFDDVAIRRLERARDSMAAHHARQLFIADAAASEARINEFSDTAAAAWDDPKTVATAIAGARAEAAELASKAGLDADTAKSRVQEAETGIHARVIDAMLANAMPNLAKSYFQRNRDRIDGRRHSEIERHILAAKNRQAVELRDDTKDAISILDAGKTPVGLAQLREAVKGTKLSEPLEQAIADQAIMADFNGKTLPERAAELRALDRKQTVTGDEFRRLQKKAKAYAATVQRVAAGDGLAVAADAGMIGEPVTVEWNDPETLRARARQAELASRGLGVRVSPLTPAEADGLAADLSSGQSAARTTELLDTLRESFGSDGATLIASQLTKGQRPELAAAVILSEHDKLTAAQIVQGARLKRETAGLEIPVADKRTAIADVFGDAFAGTDGQALGPFIAAGEALYAARRIPGGDLSFDADEYAKALNDAAGGVVRFNDRNVIPPRPGMTADDVEDVLDKLTDADLARFGNGAPIVGDGTAVPASKLFGQAGLFRDGLGGQLVSVGPGLYRVMLPGLGFLQTEDGIYELDLRRAMEDR